MDAPRTAIAEKCLQASYDGTMSFPEIVATLIEAGFEGYTVDYRRNATTYYSDGDSVVLNQPQPPDEVAAAFDGTGIAALIKWAQANPPDYSYAAFSKNVKALGCAGYIVSFAGRRVVYFGRTAETHVEHMPQ